MSARIATDRIKILVVEDEPHMRLLIRETLTVDPRLLIYGETNNATEAIAIAQRAQPDLVILDHYIEGDIMGTQAAPMIKAAAPDAKIILFSSHIFAFKSSRDSAIDSYMSKSSMNELLAGVQRLTGLA